jgi:hypothetical protein
MPLIYRDIKRPHEIRLPPWLEGALDVQRQEADGGDYVGQWDPMYFQVTSIPANTAWKALPDGWLVALLGEFVPALCLRQTPGLPLLLPAHDDLGRAWSAPAVLDPLGHVALARPLGIVDGVWARVATDDQRRWIAAATMAREEITATVETEAGTVSRFTQLPLAVGAELACTLLCAVYHLSPEVIGQLGLMDERLMGRVLASSAGFVGGAGNG